MNCFRCRSGLKWRKCCGRRERIWKSPKRRFFCCCRGGVFRTCLGIINAIIVGFNVRPDTNAKESAARNNVDMRMYRVIYDCINEIETAMKGMLAPKFKEVELGQAEVRNVFRITGVGMVAGCYVTGGKMQRGAQMRLLRDNIVIYDGAIASLQRFKDSVKEVAQGYECGITFEKFQDIKEGDVIEAYLMEQIEV